MKRAIYVLSLWAIALWTLFCVATTIWGMVAVGQLLAELEGESQFIRGAAQTGAGIGVMLNLWIWGLVVVPLGVIALICKSEKIDRPPRDYVVVERREPRLFADSPPRLVEYDDSEEARH